MALPSASSVASEPLEVSAPLDFTQVSFYQVVGSIRISGTAMATFNVSAVLPPRSFRVPTGFVRPSSPTTCQNNCIINVAVADNPNGIGPSHATVTPSSFDMGPGNMGAYESTSFIIDFTAAGTTSRGVIFIIFTADPSNALISVPEPFAFSFLNMAQYSVSIPPLAYSGSKLAVEVALGSVVPTGGELTVTITASPKRELVRAAGGGREAIGAPHRISAIFKAGQSSTVVDVFTELDATWDIVEFVFSDEGVSSSQYRYVADEPSASIRIMRAKTLFQDFPSTVFVGQDLSANIRTNSLIAASSSTNLLSTSGYVAEDDEFVATVAVPSNSGWAVRAKITSATDLDLVIESYDGDFGCDSTSDAGFEVCTVEIPAEFSGDLHIIVEGYEAGSFSLSVDRIAPNSDLDSDSGHVDLASWEWVEINVPILSGWTFTATTSATADVDLYVQFLTQPDRTTYDCSSITVSGIETCTLVIPDSFTGPLWVGVYGYEAGDYLLFLEKTDTIPKILTASGQVGFQQFVDYPITVPLRSDWILTATIIAPNATVDADLYLRTDLTADNIICQSITVTTKDECTFTVPPTFSGTLYVSVYGFKAGVYYLSVGVTVNSKPWPLPPISMLLTVAYQPAFSPMIQATPVAAVSNENVFAFSNLTLAEKNVIYTMPFEAAIGHVTMSLFGPGTAAVMQPPDHLFVVQSKIVSKVTWESNGLYAGDGALAGVPRKALLFTGTTPTFIISLDEPIPAGKDLTMTPTVTNAAAVEAQIVFTANQASATFHATIPSSSTTTTEWAETVAAVLSISFAVSGSAANMFSAPVVDDMNIWNRVAVTHTLLADMVVAATMSVAEVKMDRKFKRDGSPPLPFNDMLPEEHQMIRPVEIVSSDVSVAATGSSLNPWTVLVPISESVNPDESEPMSIVAGPVPGTLTINHTIVGPAAIGLQELPSTVIEIVERSTMTITSTGTYAATGSSSSVDMTITLSAAVPSTYGAPLTIVPRLVFANPSNTIAQLTTPSVEVAAGASTGTLTMSLTGAAGVFHIALVARGPAAHLYGPGIDVDPLFKVVVIAADSILVEAPPCMYANSEAMLTITLGTALAAGQDLTIDVALDTDVLPSHAATDASQALEAESILVTRSGYVADKEWYYTSIEVSPASTWTVIATTTSTVDIDLYMRYTSEPTTDLYDCRANSVSVTEVCTLEVPDAFFGTLYIGVYGYHEGSYTLMVVKNEVSTTNKAFAAAHVGLKEWYYAQIAVPLSSGWKLTAKATASADIDLYIRYTDQPTVAAPYDYSDYACVANSVSVTEECTIDVPDAFTGTLWVGVYGFHDGSFTLTVDLPPIAGSPAQTSQDGIMQVVIPAMSDSASFKVTSGSITGVAVISYSTHWTTQPAASVAPPTTTITVNPQFFGTPVLPKTIPHSTLTRAQINLDRGIATELLYANYTIGLQSSHGTNASESVSTRTTHPVPSLRTASGSYAQPVYITTASVTPRHVFLQGGNAHSGWNEGGRPRAFFSIASGTTLGGLTLSYGVTGSPESLAATAFQKPEPSIVIVTATTVITTLSLEPVPKTVQMGTTTVLLAALSAPLPFVSPVTGSDPAELTVIIRTNIGRLKWEASRRSHRRPTTKSVEHGVATSDPASSDATVRASGASSRESTEIRFVANLNDDTLGEFLFVAPEKVGVAEITVTYVGNAASVFESPPPIRIGLTAGASIQNLPVAIVQGEPSQKVSIMLEAPVPLGHTLTFVLQTEFPNSIQMDPSKLVVRALENTASFTLTATQMVPWPQSIILSPQHDIGDTELSMADLFRLPQVGTLQVQARVTHDLPTVLVGGSTTIVTMKISSVPSNVTVTVRTLQSVPSHENSVDTAYREADLTVAAMRFSDDCRSVSFPFTAPSLPDTHIVTTGLPITASSEASLTTVGAAYHIAVNAFDGNTTATRWASTTGTAEPAWLKIDLGVIRDIKFEISIMFEAAFAESYEFQSSVDDVTWSTIPGTAVSGNTVSDAYITSIATTATPTRYLRLFVLKFRAGYANVSVFNIMLKALYDVAVSFDFYLSGLGQAGVAAIPSVVADVVHPSDIVVQVNKRIYAGQCVSGKVELAGMVSHGINSTEVSVTLVGADVGGTSAASLVVEDSTAATSSIVTFTHLQSSVKFDLCANSELMPVKDVWIRVSKISNINHGNTTVTVPSRDTKVTIVARHGITVSPSADSFFTNADIDITVKLANPVPVGEELTVRAATMSLPPTEGLLLAASPMNFHRSPIMVIGAGHDTVLFRATTGSLPTTQRVTLSLTGSSQFRYTTPPPLDVPVAGIEPSWLFLELSETHSVQGADNEYTLWVQPSRALNKNDVIVVSNLNSPLESGANVAVVFDDTIEGVGTWDNAAAEPEQSNKGTLRIFVETMISGTMAIRFTVPNPDINQRTAGFTRIDITVAAESVMGDIGPTPIPRSGVCFEGFAPCASLGEALIPAPAAFGIKTISETSTIRGDRNRLTVRLSVPGMDLQPDSVVVISGLRNVKTPATSTLELFGSDADAFESFAEFKTELDADGQIQGKVIMRAVALIPFQIRPLEISFDVINPSVPYTGAVPVFAEIRGTPAILPTVLDVHVGGRKTPHSHVLQGRSDLYPAVALLSVVESEPNILRADNTLTMTILMGPCAPMTVGDQIIIKGFARSMTEDGPMEIKNANDVSTPLPFTAKYERGTLSLTSTQSVGTSSVWGISALFTNPMSPPNNATNVTEFKVATKGRLPTIEATNRFPVLLAASPPPVSFVYAFCQDSTDIQNVNNTVSCVFELNRMVDGAADTVDISVGLSGINSPTPSTPTLPVVASGPLNDTAVWDQVAGTVSVQVTGRWYLQQRVTFTVVLLNGAVGDTSNVSAVFQRNTDVEATQLVSMTVPAILTPTSTGPGWIRLLAKQSSSTQLDVNDLAFAFAANVDLTPTDVITITGMTQVTFPPAASAFPIGERSDSIVRNEGFLGGLGQAVWTPSNGTLELTPRRTIPRGTEVQIYFRLINPNVADPNKAVSLKTSFITETPFSYNISFADYMVDADEFYFDWVQECPARAGYIPWLVSYYCPCVEGNCNVLAAPTANLATRTITQPDLTKKALQITVEPIADFSFEFPTTDSPRNAIFIGGAGFQNTVTPIGGVVGFKEQICKQVDCSLPPLISQCTMTDTLHPDVRNFALLTDGDRYVECNVLRPWLAAEKLTLTLDLHSTEPVEEIVQIQIWVNGRMDYFHLDGYETLFRAPTVPQLTSVQPPSESINIPSNQIFAFSFDQKVELSNIGVVRFFEKETNEQVGEALPCEANSGLSLKGDSGTVYVQGPPLSSDGSQYFMMMDACCIRAQATLGGLCFEGVVSSAGHTFFATGGPVPLVDSLDPPNGVTVSPGITTFTVVFDERVIENAGVISIHDAVQHRVWSVVEIGGLGESSDDDTFIHVEGDTVVITIPADALDTGNSYYVKIPPAAFLSEGTGASFAGFLTASDWKITVDVRPGEASVLALSPPPFSTTANEGLESLSILFDLPMQTPDDSTGAITVRRGLSFAIVAKVSCHDVTFSDGNTLATIKMPEDSIRSVDRETSTDRSFVVDFDEGCFENVDVRGDPHPFRAFNPDDCPSCTGSVDWKFYISGGVAPKLLATVPYAPIATGAYTLDIEEEMIFGFRISDHLVARGGLINMYSSLDSSLVAQWSPLNEATVKLEFSQQDTGTGVDRDTTEISLTLKKANTLLVPRGVYYFTVLPKSFESQTSGLEFPGFTDHNVYQVTTKSGVKERMFFDPATQTGISLSSAGTGLPTSINIPFGAAPAGVTGIGMESETAPTTMTPPAGVTLTGRSDAVTFSPSGTQFSTPVTVCLQYYCDVYDPSAETDPTATIQFAKQIVGTDGVARWVPQSNAVTMDYANCQACAQLSSFSTYMLATVYTTPVVNPVAPAIIGKPVVVPVPTADAYDTGCPSCPNYWDTSGCTAGAYCALYDPITGKEVPNLEFEYEEGVLDAKSGDQKVQKAEATDGATAVRYSTIAAITIGIIKGVSGGVAAGLAGGGAAGGAAGFSSSFGVQGLIYQAQFTAITGKMGRVTRANEAAGGANLLPDVYSEDFAGANTWVNFKFESPFELRTEEEIAADEEYYKAKELNAPSNRRLLDSALRAECEYAGEIKNRIAGNIFYVILVVILVSLVRMGVVALIRYWIVNKPLSGVDVEKGTWTTPAELRFPSWELTALLVEYYGLCESLGEAFSSNCGPLIFAGVFIASMPLIPLIIFVIIQLRKNISNPTTRIAVFKNFDIRQLTFKKFVADIRETDGWQEKVDVFEDYKGKIVGIGSWNTDDVADTDEDKERGEADYLRKLDPLIGAYRDGGIFPGYWFVLVAHIKMVIIGVAIGVEDYTQQAALIFTVSAIEATIIVLGRPYADWKSNFVEAIASVARSFALLALLMAATGELTADETGYWMFVTNLGAQAVEILGVVYDQIDEILGLPGQIVAFLGLLASCGLTFGFSSDSDDEGDEEEESKGSDDETDDNTDADSVVGRDAAVVGVAENKDPLEVGRDDASIATVSKAGSKTGSRKSKITFAQRLAAQQRKEETSFRKFALAGLVLTAVVLACCITALATPWYRHESIYRVSAASFGPGGAWVNKTVTTWEFSTIVTTVTPTAPIPNIVTFEDYQSGSLQNLLHAELGLIVTGLVVGGALLVGWLLLAVPSSRHTVLLKFGNTKVRTVFTSLAITLITTLAVAFVLFATVTLSFNADVEGTCERDECKILYGNSIDQLGKGRLENPIRGTYEKTYTGQPAFFERVGKWGLDTTWYLLAFNIGASFVIVLLAWYLKLPIPRFDDTEMTEIVKGRREETALADITGPLTTRGDGYGPPNLNPNLDESCVATTGTVDVGYFYAGHSSMRHNQVHPGTGNSVVVPSVGMDEINAAVGGDNSVVNGWVSGTVGPSPVASPSVNNIPAIYGNTVHGNLGAATLVPMVPMSVAGMPPTSPFKVNPVAYTTAFVPRSSPQLLRHRSPQQFQHSPQVVDSRIVDVYAGGFASPQRDNETTWFDQATPQHMGVPASVRLGVSEVGADESVAHAPAAHPFASPLKVKYGVPSPGAGVRAPGVVAPAGRRNLNSTLNQTIGADEVNDEIGGDIFHEVHGDNINVTEVGADAPAPAVVGADALAPGQHGPAAYM